jgi:peptidoglycan/LPS O-acetylase OafA/YrhL
VLAAPPDQGGIVTVGRPYRDDIDWLRAIAVLAVVAFHFEAPAVFGGFAGVDIFFVISGYLITGIVQSEVKSGTFSLAGFYERRARRLLPALYLMVALTAIPSFHYLLTSERLEFFRSAAAVVTFTSNFFFWLQAGYFDHAAAEKPLLHTWSLAVEEQFYLALPLLLWGLLRFARGRIALPVALGALALASFVSSIWLMRRGQSTSAFFMSPPRAWEFLIGGLVATPDLPLLRNALAQQIARGAALVLIAIPIFSLRQGPGFPGFNALAPCIGAAMFIWSGTAVPAQTRGRYSPLTVLKFFGQISYSLYLWHWPLFTFARFSKSSLVLNAIDKTTLFALTVAISYLSWRFVEQPFRKGMLVPTRRAAFRIAGLATVVLLAGSAGGIVTAQTSSDVDRAAMSLDVYDSYDVRPIYRAGVCFRYDGGAVDEAICLGAVAGKQNVLLWGDSYAAQYYHGLIRAIDPERVNLLQADQAACMPTSSAASQGYPACHSFAAHMSAYFRDHKPDLVIMAADWLEYARPPRFDGMISNIKQTIARLNGAGVPVVLIGPAVQFRARLPSMLMRAHLRNIDPAPEDFVLPDIFSLDRMMKAALPAHDGFSYVSVVDAVCPARKCPLTVEGGVPLAWDHAHLTAEGSVYVADRLAPMLGLKKRL